MERSATTPQVLRHANLRAVLDVMRRRGTVTGTDLIEATGLTRATAIAVCDDLAARGWVREVEGVRSTAQRGRSARRFELDPGAGHVLGIDVGLATATVLVADLGGAVVGRASSRFPGDAKATVAQRRQTIDATAARALGDAGLAPGHVLAAGVGVSTVVDRRGRIAPGHPLAATFDLDLPGTVWADRAWPVLLANDANLAALAEHWRGVGAGEEDLAVMLAGERLGTGLIEGGRLLHGSGGGAGEVGSSLGLVEGVGSQDGIAKLARHWGSAALREGRETLIRDLVGPDTDRASARYVFEAAAAGDPVALGILDRIARRVARVVALVGTFLDPALVVIGGAVARSAAMLLPRMEAELPRLMDVPPRLAVSDMGDELVATGALRLALDHVESNLLELEPRPAAPAAAARAGS